MDHNRYSFSSKTSSSNRRKCPKIHAQLDAAVSTGDKMVMVLLNLFVSRIRCFGFSRKTSGSRGKRFCLAAPVYVPRSVSYQARTLFRFSSLAYFVDIAHARVTEITSTQQKELNNNQTVVRHARTPDRCQQIYVPAETGNSLLRRLFTTKSAMVDSNVQEQAEDPLVLKFDFQQDIDPLTFKQDGFIVYKDVMETNVVDALNDRLEEILRGNFDRGQKPDKTPRLIRAPRRETANERDKQKSALGFSGNFQNVKVLQVINVHKSDTLFRKLASSPELGCIVATLAGWKHGARLAQDQIWAKPPKAAPLVFHRDSPYFMFDPPDVVTVWVALDDMDEEIGPLEYVKGSHNWGDGRVGSANQFFQSDGGYALLRSAAEREGLDFSDLDFVSMAGLKAGGISIHDGRTWHGSKKNESTSRPRRGLGLHFVPAQVKFTEDASKSSLWRPYVRHVEKASEVLLPEEDFPITWTDASACAND